MSTHPDWPGEEEGRRLHAALSGGDPTDQSAFANAFYAPLCAYLERTYPRMSEDAITDVAGNLILALIKAPAGYNPDRLPVCAFLRMAARRKLLTAREREARRRAKHVPLGSVAEPAGDGNTRAEADGGLGWGDPRIDREVAAFSPAERAAFDLMCGGARDTATFARALGLDPHRAGVDREVKRLKDTIKARLRRAVGGR